MKRHLSWAAGLLIFSFVCSSRGQLNIEGCSLDTLTNEVVSNEIAANAPGGEGGVPIITILSRVTNCLAAGMRRDLFRFATLTLNLTGIRASDPDQAETVQVDFSCSLFTTIVFWELDALSIISDPEVITNITVATDTNTILATDCARCTSDGLGMDDDELLHCDRCDDECLIDEQRLCWGTSSTMCCNVYIDDICMNECPPNQIANEATQFECVCNLQCLNEGTPTSDCTGCICPGPEFTGDLCEDPCSPDQCRNGTCQPDGAFDGFNCTCDPGYTGSLCEIPIDPCDGITCSNNGVCKPISVTEFICKCDAGFTGDVCDVVIDQCDPNPCLNGGSCIQETFPSLNCECLPNFSGNFCQNCDLPNCKTCSLTQGICTECFQGYLLANDGICGIDCTICNERESQSGRNICNFYCLLNAWAEDVNAQGLDITGTFTEPSSDLSIPDQLTQIAGDANSAETVWTDEARTAELLASLQPPNRSGITLADWVSDSRTWLANINAWLEYIRADVDPDFPAFDFQSLANQLEDDPQAAYDTINEMWILVTTEFTTRVLNMG